MPKPEDGEKDILDKRAKKRLVGEFVVAYINGDITVDTTKVVKVNRRERLLRDAPKPPAQYKTMQERAAWETLALKRQRQIESTPYLATDQEAAQDSRFINLDIHVDKYAGVMPQGGLPIEEKERAGEWLYSMILLLMKEKRIKGDFRLQPHRDAEIEKLNKRMENFEKRLASTNRIVERMATGR